eukprot:s19_g53.t1
MELFQLRLLQRCQLLQLLQLLVAAPEGDGSRLTEAAEVEKTEPSASRPETEKGSEKKHGEKTPEELDSEAMRAAKRARQDMTQAEVEEEGMSDHDVTMKCLRLVQSSLEYQLGKLLL